MSTNDLSDFTNEKNDGACTTYSKKEKYFHNIKKPEILCPLCKFPSLWRDDNTYICPECKNVFTSEKFILE